MNITVLSAFESLLSVFFGNSSSDLVTYLSQLLTILVTFGLISLLVGMFNRKAGKYLGIVALAACVTLSLCYYIGVKIPLLPQSVVTII